MDVLALARYLRSMRTPYRCALAEELAALADSLDVRALVTAAHVAPLDWIKRQQQHLRFASRSLRRTAKAIEINDSTPHRQAAKTRKTNKHLSHSNVDNSVDN